MNTRASFFIVAFLALLPVACASRSDQLMPKDAASHGVAPAVSSPCGPYISYSPVVTPTYAPSPGQILTVKDVSSSGTATNLAITATFYDQYASQETGSAQVQAFDFADRLVASGTIPFAVYPPSSSTQYFSIYYGSCNLSRVTVALTENTPTSWDPSYALSQSATLTYPAQPTPSPSPSPSPAVLWLIGAPCSTAQGGCPIYRSSDNGNSYTEVPGNAVDISADASGNMWLVNLPGNIYSYKNGALTQMPGSASDIAVDGNTIWVLSSTCNNQTGGCEIWQSTNGGQSYAQLNGTALDIAADGSGNAWVINASGSIYKYSSTTGAVVHVKAPRAHTRLRGIIPIGNRVHANGFTQVPGTGSDIAAFGNTVWVLGTTCDSSANCQIYRSTDGGQSWVQAAGSAKDISVDQSGNAWITNSAGNIYRYSPSANGFVQVPGSGNDIAAGGTR